MMQLQELHCHECQQYVQFEIDDGLDGEHILNCPKCNHQHYRVVDKGVVTSTRWGSDNRNIIIGTSATGYATVPSNYTAYTITTATYSATSAWDNYSSNSTTTDGTGQVNQGTVSMMGSWMNSYYRYGS